MHNIPFALFGEQLSVMAEMSHRKRMEKEAKALLVASVWGAKFVQFLTALAVLPRSISVEETVEFILFFLIDRGKTASAARNLTNFAPQIHRHDDFCLGFCPHPSSMIVTLRFRFVGNILFVQTFTVVIPFLYL